MVEFRIAQGIWSMFSILVLEFVASVSLVSRILRRSTQDSRFHFVPDSITPILMNNL
jgi:hypothetical protein